MKLPIILFAVICMSKAATAQDAEGVLIRCGASTGHAFFFYDEVFNPEGSKWREDALSAGRII